jgi:hypothetical protein
MFAAFPWGNDTTLTNFNGWRDLNPPKGYTKYDHNKHDHEVCKGQNELTCLRQRL